MFENKEESERKKKIEFQKRKQLELFERNSKDSSEILRNVVVQEIKRYKNFCKFHPNSHSHKTNQCNYGKRINRRKFGRNKI